MSSPKAIIPILIAVLVASLTTPARAGQHQRPGPSRDRTDEGKPAATATLLLTPARRTLEVGETFRLTVVALGARELLRMPATVRYDPDVLRFEAVEAGSAWRTGPAPVLLHDSSRAGVLVVGISRLGTDSPISGVAEVLELTFSAIAPGSSELRLERFALIGAGRAQPSRARPARLDVR